MIEKEGMQEIGKFKEVFTVIKYRNDEDFRKGKAYQILVDIYESKENCLLNAGITLMWNLIAGLSALHYAEASAQIGIGTDTTAAAPAQTDLLDVTAEWVAMDVDFPAVAAQKITFAGTFGDGAAEYSWRECGVRQAGAATTLINRVVGDKGVKVAGETWVAKLEITLT